MSIYTYRDPGFCGANNGFQDGDVVSHFDRWDRIGVVSFNCGSKGFYVGVNSIDGEDFPNVYVATFQTFREDIPTFAFGADSVTYLDPAL